jgi:hypothetical protein
LTWMRSAVRICLFLPLSLSFPDASGYRFPHGFERFPYLLITALSMLLLKLEEGVHKAVKLLERFGSTDHRRFAYFPG